MKTVFRLILSCIALAGGMLQAQAPLSLPNGSFEQWTTHPGYNVNVLFMSLPVYDTFFTPTGWDYLSYPVNQTTTFMGMNININTNVPLVKSTPETGTVPDGNSAVRLQTIKLEDIIDPTILSLAGDALDSSMTERIIPSILSTGELDIDAFMPLITDLMSGSGNILSMLPTLLAMDVNEYVTGGLALNGFRPARITGSYKYHSAVGGDNGAIIMIGTHYNATTHKREIVGGGINLALTDTAAYTSFETEYASLGSLLPGYAGSSPDSLVVLLLSSAGNNMQQGSYLCLDNLTLWPAPDTCASVEELSLWSRTYDVFPEMVLEWQGSNQTSLWQVEYGPQGFIHGDGTTVEINQTHFNIFELENNGTLTPNTWYDFYVRSVCDDDIYGEWDSVHYRTFCASVEDLTSHGDGNNLQLNADNLIEGYSISWTDNTDTRRWSVHYGIYSSEMPDSWGTYVETDTTYFEFPPLEPGKTYTVEVSALCGDDNYGDIMSINFTTRSNAGMDNPQNPSMPTIYPNPANGQCTVAFPDNQPTEITLYSSDGRTIQSVTTDGAPVVLHLPQAGIYILHTTSDTGTATCKIISR